MTQLAASTLSYDQIYIKIRDFYLDSRNRKFKTLEDESEAYGKMLREIYSGLGSPLAKYDPYIKGEPLRSEKINNFTKTYADDINIIARQTDFLVAKVVNIFNMFFTETENEKKYLERIGSKINLLQMYSRSPENNLFYFGDSFDNMDKVDVTKIRERLMPLITNGQCTLPISRSRSSRSKKIILNKTDGFLGNSHKVVKSTSSDGSSSYRYVFEDSPTIGVLNGLTDSNPLTYVEFEALNVDKSVLTSPGEIGFSDWEFSYLINNQSDPALGNGQLIDWSNFDMSKPLEASYVIEYTSSKANSIDIVPFFGSSNLVKVKDIVFTKKDGSTVSVLPAPIYIGSTFIPPTPQISKMYYYNKATIKFSEIDIFKVEVFLEQENIEQIEIGHIYWKTNYPSNTPSDNPFVGMNRFDPEILSNDIYEEIEYDINDLVPSSDRPTEFKLNGVMTKSIPVRLKTRPTTYSFWVIAFDADLQFDQVEGNNVKYYFRDWTTGIEAPYNGFSSVPSFSRDENGLNIKYFNSEQEGQEDLSALIALVDGVADNVIDMNNLQYKISNIRLERVSYTDSGRSVNYSVPLISARKIIPAQRKSIGIRDISVYHETYANKAEVVSKPFVYDKPVEAVTLSVNSTVDNSFSDKINLNYYISVSDGKWIPISPVQLDNRSIAEVLMFNKNISDSAKLPGVAYLNYPEVPQEIKKISVKIEMSKNRNANITPVIYSYELITKVIN